MSKTFAPRPGLTNARGRGRGTQTRQVEAVNANRLERTNNTMEARDGARPRQPPRARVQVPPPAGRDRMAVERQTDSNQSAASREEGSDIERRMTYQGGYSMIAPNQRKREQISQVAQRETQAYQEHVQQNTASSFNYVGTAGGGQMSMGAARRRLVQESPSKTQKLLKKEEKKTYFKQKEEEELQKKKDEQRKKALQNERKDKEKEEASAHRWDNQRKVANDAFLRRIENKNKKAAAAMKSTSSQPTQSSVSSSGSSERLQPAGARRNESLISLGSDSCPHQYDELDPQEFQRLSQLAAIFPQYSETELLEILKQVDFSLDSAVAILQD